MKISNETKVGALTSIAIVLLILGFNFLKGNSFSSKASHYYAVFGNTQGIAISNPVIINGNQIGTVVSIDGGKDMRRIVIGINITKAVDIPTNSTAVINPSILGTTALEIKLDSLPTTTLYKSGDTLATKPSAGMFDEAFQKVDPVLTQVRVTLGTLDTLLRGFTKVLDASTQENIRGTMASLNKTMASLAQSATSIQTMLNAQSGSIAKTMDNVSSFTGTLAKNNDKLTETMANLDKTSENFSRLDFQKSLTTVDSTLNELKIAVKKINSEDGTIGKLLNNAALYNNLTATSNKINLLLDDIRVHPKRYVSISVFGKKTKDAPLDVPTPDTLNAPYLHK